MKIVTMGILFLEMDVHNFVKLRLIIPVQVLKVVKVIVIYVGMDFGQQQRLVMMGILMILTDVLILVQSILIGLVIQVTN